MNMVENIHKGWDCTVRRYKLCLFVTILFLVLWHAIFQPTSDTWTFLQVISILSPLFIIWLSLCITVFTAIAESITQFAYRLRFQCVQSPYWLARGCGILVEFGGPFILFLGAVPNTLFVGPCWMLMIALSAFRFARLSRDTSVQTEFFMLQKSQQNQLQALLPDFFQKHVTNFSFICFHLCLTLSGGLPAILFRRTCGVTRCSDLYAVESEEIVELDICADADVCLIQSVMLYIWAGSSLFFISSDVIVMFQECVPSVFAVMLHKLAKEAPAVLQSSWVLRPAYDMGWSYLAPQTSKIITTSSMAWRFVFAYFFFQVLAVLCIFVFNLWFHLFFILAADQDQTDKFSSCMGVVVNTCKVAACICVMHITSIPGAFLCSTTDLIGTFTE